MRRLQKIPGVVALLISSFCLPSLMPAQNTLQPKAPQLRFTFEEQVTLAADIPVGETPMGKRNIVPITGGTFEGSGLHGKIMPGGWDWQLTHPSGCFDLHADYMIQTNDGVIIHVINQGMVCPNSAGKRDGLFTTPTFEAPKGKYDWLDGGVYVGTVEGMKIDGKPGVRIRFFKAFAD
ncbi:DUF3237 domain-containing protein [Occallatibacter savannae]|uniref:DUF3237 domain-containing protein n=1 Tax=Occallatibacter savannae TaxID=1002691 RepID=UPI0019505DC6|nr:DUF3237 domain-containing protein [Occallatibacter savannae]